MNYGATTWLSIGEFSFETISFKQFNNFNGYPLKVSMFHRYPTAVDQTKQKLPRSILASYFSDAFQYSHNFGGIDGLVLGNVAWILNFTIIIKDSNNHYGDRTSNGSFVGLHLRDRCFM